MVSTSTRGSSRGATTCPRYPGRWIYTSPVIADGTVYTGGKAGYGAYEVKTGEEQLVYDIDHTGRVG